MSIGKIVSVIVYLPVIIIAADRYAFENVANPKADIKFLLSEWWLSPITNTIRLFHAWKYMKNK